MGSISRLTFEYNHHHSNSLHHGASISICFLLRHLNRRCLRPLSTVSFISIASDSRYVSPVNPPPPTSSSSSAIVDSLPLFTYSSITRRSTSVGGRGDEGDCVVGLSKFES
ncbi:hypothetical protein Dsin_016262 [Dipteronia sinensis]|uniref:Uncharacterized protein n=1 Tax=Dipteronia sinensis TaxID=43782 RepID=A0AAE0ACR3_9ROSI|nr:hypothetical protein Dsin_016262 [Dipteronia sinensis]